MAEPKLTPKQAAFCAEYLVDLNATAAAKRAGFSQKTANEQAVRLMGLAHVQAEIQRLMTERSKRTEITQDGVIREIAKLAFGDIRKLFDENGALLPVQQWPDDIAPAVSSVEIDELFEGFGENRVQIGHTKKVKFWDKAKSLEMLGRHLKLFVDRAEVSGPGGGPIPVKTETDLSTLTDDELAQLEAIRAAADSRSNRG